MKSKKRYYFGSILLVFFLLSVFILSSNKPDINQPTAKNGYLDLSNWDFHKQGNVKLDGEWEFYWNRLLTPKDFSETGNNDSDGFVRVPSSWKGNIGTTEVTDKGVATYRLKVRLSDYRSVLGIKTTSIRMSSRIFVNGVEVLSSGSPALNRESGYVMANTPYSTYFKPDSEEIEILVQVSDFDYKAGGIVQSIYIGDQKSIYMLSVRNNFLNGFLAASLLVTGLYYLFVYIGRRQDLSIFYYSVYAISFSLFEVLYGEKILLQMFETLSNHYIIVAKIHNVILYMTIIFVCLFAQEITKNAIPKWFNRAIVFMYGSYSIAFLIFPLDIISKYQNVALLIGMASYAFIIMTLFKSIIKKQFSVLSQSELMSLVVAFTCVLIYFVDGTLYLNNLRSNNYIGYASMLIFLVNIFALLSKQYNKSYNTMEKMSIELQTLDQLKNEFLANTSHELRTPLNGIINITSSVIENSNKKLDEEQKQNLEVVISAARRLYNLINDILDISSLKNREIKLNKRPVDLRSVAELTLYVLSQLKGTKALELINLIPEELPPVDADVERLRQIFYNLIGNSLKFTEHGKIEVGALVRKDYVEIWVEDTGCGIPKDKLEDIFKPFYQVDTTATRDVGGTGLGLSITKTLVELHKGSIRVSSEEGKGSKFIFTLPISEEQKNATYIETSVISLQKTPAVSTLTTGEEMKKRPYSILAVDDDPASLTALFNILDNEGYYVKAVTSGEEVMKALDGLSRYNLVILDVMMPKISGYDVLKKIRIRFQPMDLPVLMLTAKARPEDFQAGFEAGANDYLAKPFEALELKARVHTLVQLKESVSNVVETELSFLQAQIKPHFIYNSLSVIAALTSETPQKAKELLYDLTDYLRGSFRFNNYNGLVPLTEELATVKAYISIERARFEDKLEVEYDIDETLSVALPMLTLQPIVENAVRHGLFMKPEGGFVRLSVYRENDYVVISVKDNGGGISADTLEMIFLDHTTLKGVGLKNIIRRLKIFYGEGLHIKSEVGKGTEVSFRIPIENEEQ